MIYALHGMLGGPEDWEALGLDDLVALNLWDYHGSLEEVGAQIAQDVAGRGDPEPVLMGYSMGGRLALHALLDRPVLWKRAIIISAHPGLKSEAERVARRASDAVWAEKVRGMAWSDFLREWNAQPVLAGQAASPEQLALESRRGAIARAFVDWSLGAQQPVDLKMETMGFEIDWITGEQDAKFTALAETLSGVTHHIVPDCGHRVPFERPEFLGAIVGTR